MVEQIRLPFPGKDLFEQDDDILLASLIFSNARDDIEQAKIGIGCVVRNRVKNPRWWGRNYKQVTVPLIGPYKITKEEKELILFPIRNGLSDKWDQCYLISKNILNDSILDNTFNSDYFFLSSEKLPGWINGRHKSITTKSWYVFTAGEIRFYRVELKPLETDKKTSDS